MSFLLGNPLLPLLLWCVLFLWIWAFRTNWLVVVSGTVGALLLFLLLSPGGEVLGEATGQLSSPGERARCLGDALWGGTFWNEELPSSCRYRSSLLP